ncbi:ABC transporter substrate-binding protein, partial [Bacillus toyonensis]
LSKRSGGKFKMKGFGDASLGSDIQMQNALIGGAQEMMVGSTATLVGIVKDFGVYDLPFLFNNEKEADAVLDGPFGEKLLKSLNDKGLVGLVYWENGFRNLTNSKRPITKVE